jgi:hypothetical protein
MYLIEDADHTLVPDGKGRTTFKSLSVVHRPDGGMTTNAKPGDLYDELERGLKICEATILRIGEGDKYAGRTGPVFEDGQWIMRDTYVERPEPVDPTEDTDADYADRYGEYRRQAYEATGATTDALIVALWEKLVEDRDESAAALQSLREAVKTRFPAPGAAEEEEAATEAAEVPTEAAETI